MKKESKFIEHINEDVPEEVIARLMKIKEFQKAYEPDGMAPSDFIAFGLVQKTLSKFAEAGWNPIKEY